MMKKAFCFIGSVIGVIAGLMAIWKLVIPFIGCVFSWFTGAL